jgi:hypothetical protein
MNLLFEKTDLQTIKVKINSNGQKTDFDYMSLIKEILSSGSLDESELIGDFSAVEKSSIESMVHHLNECVPKNEKDEEIDTDDSE